MPTYSILSEEALEHLVCSQCYKYLSFGVPKLGRNKLICQRCDQKECIIPLFDNNILTYLFPCINRFDNDCNELIPFANIEAHEKNCTTDVKHECCECKYSGNGCQLYHHFLKIHPNNCLKHSEFDIYLLEDKKFNYIFRKVNNLFLITYQIIKTDNVLKLSITCMGKKDEATCQMTVTSFTTKKAYLKTDFKYYLNEEINILDYIRKNKENKITCELNVNVSSDLYTFKCYKNEVIKQNHNVISKEKSENQIVQIMKALNENLFPKLRCSCRCYVIPPIWQCPSNHVFCETCFSSYCPTCDEIVNLTRAYDLEIFSDIVPLPCRWECQTVLLHSELRSHERTCCKRRYKCTEKWCLWSGTLQELINHKHGLVYSCIHEVYGYNEGLVEFYLTHNHGVFYLRMGPLKKIGRHFHIRKVSNVSTQNETYSARVELKHTCDGVTKKRHAFLKFGGITLLDSGYFTYFGECKNYKIVFSVALIS